MVSFMPWLLYFWGKNCQYLLNRKLSQELPRTASKKEQGRGEKL